MTELKCVILTISDTCAGGTNIDTSGPYLAEAVKKTFSHRSVSILSSILSDDMLQIEESLKLWSDRHETQLILTTGGTGFTARDVTPEATRKVIEKEAPGISTAICVNSLKMTDMAMLSRGVCGIRKKTLIINFPGSLKAVKECYGFVEKVLQHAIDQVSGNPFDVSNTHSVIQGDNARSRSKCHHHDSNDSPDKVAYRKRESTFPMIEVDEANNYIGQIVNCLPDVSFESVPLSDCLNRVLWEDVTAKDPFPPFPASTKDGYACRAADGVGARAVMDDVLAGDEGGCSLSPGECSRISTGAPVPPRADCVVQVEDTKLLEHSPDGTVEYKIEVMVRPKVGQDIRAVGSDIMLNETVLVAGNVIGPAEKGLLCTLGVYNLKVYNKIRIGILSTGNELQSPDIVNLKPGHIRDSNKSMLMALLGQYAECLDLGIAKDDENTLRDHLSKGFNSCQIIITTGGVSMGERDLLKHVLVKHFNGKILFGRVNMKPGKPTVLTECTYNANTSIVFGLPGNPVSAYVTSHLFVIPFLKRYQGRKNWDWPNINVEIESDCTLDPRPEYARAHFALQGSKHLPVASLTGNQISSRLTSTLDAPLLVQLPGSKTFGPTLPKGSIIPALIIGKF